jgi:nitrite reductase/ring-hydroxylating ferredoxin subunit/uncharacterized membrane protein
VKVPAPRPSGIADRLERAQALDDAAAMLDSFWGRVLFSRRVRDVLSGRRLGHPAHPAAVSVTSGLLLGATVIDLAAADDAATRQASRRLIGLGLLSAVPTVLAGWSDWIDTEQAEKRVGLVHATGNVVALSAYGLSWGLRRRGRSGRGTALLGAATMSAAGWLGGHLVFAQGVGVDTTAFQSGPQTWTDAAASSRVTEALRQVTVDGVPLLLTRVDGKPVAIADRCSHRGGPLSDGQRHGDTVDCPWHGSRFDLATGAVRCGPATRPQPAFETRERAGRVEVRRKEERALRTNPVGV